MTQFCRREGSEGLNAAARNMKEEGNVFENCIYIIYGSVHRTSCTQSSNLAVLSLECFNCWDLLPPDESISHAGVGTSGILSLPRN